MRHLLSFAADNFGLQLLETNGFKDRVRQALTNEGAWEQRDCALKAPLVMWFVFSMVLHRTTAIGILVKRLLSDFRFEVPTLSLRAITSEAFIHAKKRLTYKPLKQMFELAAAEVQPTPSFHGLRTWATDGCAMNVPDTKDNVKRFGRPKAARGTTAFPKLHFVSLVDTTTRRMRDVVAGRHDQAERTALVSLLHRLGVGDLLMLDRGFAAAWLFDLCVNEHKIQVLARVPKSWQPRRLATLGEGDYLVEVTGHVRKKRRYRKSAKVKRASATVTITMRLLEFTINGGERVRLLTSLLDPIECPAQELAELYHARWEIEIVHDEIKTHMAVVTQGSLDLPFRSKSSDGVLQEFYAMLSLYNIVRGLMVDAGELHGDSPLDISFVESLELIRTAMPHYLAASSVGARAAVYRQLVQDIADCQNSRPRRKRQCPRGVKIKMSKFPLRGKKRERLLDSTVLMG